MIGQRICPRLAALLLIFAVIFVFTLAMNIPASSLSKPVQSEALAATNRYYVAKTGNGTDPTGGWSTAFPNLQDALAAASLAGGGEIWVAEGVYYPDVGSGQSDNNPQSTFVLVNGVTLYGGFDTDDIHMAERDWETNITVLSGDIDKNDVVDENGVVVDWNQIDGENAYHVITADGVDASALLDGFTITAGDAHHFSAPDNRGGGLHCHALGIGAECSPSLTNLVFSGNRAGFDGGGMYNRAEDGGTCGAVLTNVTFIKNFAPSSGGAIYNRAVGGTSVCSIVLKDVRIYSSKAEVGGGIFCGGNGGICSPQLTNVLLSGNETTASGGGIFSIGLDGGSSSPVLTNVLMSGNWAGTSGGGMYCHGYGGTCSPLLTNVTISGNRADSKGGGMYNNESNFGNSHPEVRNSIIGNNKDSSGTGLVEANIYNADVDIILTSSVLQGAGSSGLGWINGSYLDGGGNIDDDPKFISYVNPNTAPSTDGNLRLKGNSPVIEAGDNTFIEGVLTDLAGEARIVDGDGDYSADVDMGAYEFQVYYRYLPLTNR
jgi:hypothetical protein